MEWGMSLDFIINLPIGVIHNELYVKESYKTRYFLEDFAKPCFCTNSHPERHSGLTKIPGFAKPSSIKVILNTRFSNISQIT